MPLTRWYNNTGRVSNDWLCRYCLPTLSLELFPFFLHMTLHKKTCYLIYLNEPQIFYTSIFIKKSRIRVFMRFVKVSFFLAHIPLYYCQLDVKNVKVFCLLCVSVYVTIKVSLFPQALHSLFFSVPTNANYRKALAIALQIPS